MTSAQLSENTLSSLSGMKILDAFHNKYPFIKCAETNTKRYIAILAIS